MSSIPRYFEASQSNVLHRSRLLILVYGRIRL
jgi:hypothetical protein